MKNVFITITAMLCYVAAYAQTGTWSGKIDVQGTELSLVFHLDGEKPTMDSPDQGARGIPIQIVPSGLGKVKISIPSIAAVYEGIVLTSRIVGSFTQSGMSLSVTLYPGEEKLNRPQTPRGPFPYSSEEVTFANGNVTLAGTLVLPEGYSRNTPVLLLVSGSGQQNRDEELFGHKPFAVIADAFARKGIATLRYDDRGAGESTGDFAGSTIDDFRNDALCGVEFLRNRFDKVGIMGHSEGGTIALMLSAANQADFVISLAGMAISGAETLIWQNRIALASAGFTESVIDTYCRTIGESFEVIVHGGRMPQIDNTGLPDVLKNNFAIVLTQIQSPYMKQFISTDLRPLLKSVGCPVLALNGTMDNQVDCTANIEALRNGLTENPGNMIVPVEGLNHLFQHCSTGAVTEYREIEETIAPEVLELMTRWLSGILASPETLRKE